jgi:hypothetical protein
MNVGKAQSLRVISRSILLDMARPEQAIADMSLRQIEAASLPLFN